jgi:hypothetical protein
MKIENRGLRIEDSDDELARSRAADGAWDGDNLTGSQKWRGWIDRWRLLELEYVVGQFLG